MSRLTSSILASKGAAYWEALEAIGLIDKDFSDFTLSNLYAERGDEDYEEDAEKEIKVRLSVDEESLAGQLRRALNAGSYKEFVKNFRSSIKMTLKISFTWPS